ncbi:MAG: hypothetical protein WCC22_14255, partial [Terriglobales bacterium]
NGNGCDRSTGGKSLKHSHLPADYVPAPVAEKSVTPASILGLLEIAAGHAHASPSFRGSQPSSLTLSSGKD